MSEFHSKTIWLFILLSLLSLANSFSFEEREAIYNANDCKVGGCDIVELEFSNRRKRSVGSTISIPLTVFGRQKTLNLRQSSGILISPNTPIYAAYSSTDIRVGNYQMASSLLRSQFYEDKANLAAFTIDVDSDGPKITCGIVLSENITITPINSPKNSSDSSRRQYYLAKSTYFVFRRDTLQRARTTQVPAEVYPEILLILDYSLLTTYQASIFQHIINFWNQVDALYQPLQNPRYKLSIAGIVIPMNSEVFGFPTSYGNTMNYDTAVKQMVTWLQSVRNLIPFNSYDVHMIMTALTDSNSAFTAGYTALNSVCSAVQTQYPWGGILRDNNEPEAAKITVAAHELGHALGLEHDDGDDGAGRVVDSGKIMSWTVNVQNPSREWSQRSTLELQQLMRSRDFSCMDNYPQAGSTPNINSPPDGLGAPPNHNTPPPGDNIVPVKWTSVPNGNVVSFYPSDVPSGNLLTMGHSKNSDEISIYYHQPISSLKAQNSPGNNLMFYEANNKIITLDPSIMTPKKIYVTYSNSKIFIFQS